MRFPKFNILRLILLQFTFNTMSPSFFRTRLTFRTFIIIRIAPTRSKKRVLMARTVLNHVTVKKHQLIKFLAKKTWCKVYAFSRNVQNLPVKKNIGFKRTKVFEEGKAKRRQKVELKVTGMSSAKDGNRWSSGYQGTWRPILQGLDLGCSEDFREISGGVERSK